MANGEKILEQISEKLGLPFWWVESVAVEYFDCREYLTGKELWTFDFSLLKNDDIEEIPKKKVVVTSTGIVLIQNIRGEDLGPRFLLGMAGAPVMPIPATSLAEGQVAEYYVPQKYNSIDNWDWKLEFDQHAIVFDEGKFYQWTIANFYDIPQSHRGWFKSDFLDLQPLKKINDEIQELRNQPRPSEPESLREMRRKVAEKYTALERIRAPLRESVLRYHESRKSETILPKSSPPLLTYLDSLQVVGTEYRVRSHVEPLFYRRASRCLEETKKIVEARTRGTPEAISFVDEVEASAACIVFSVLCLEAYVNFLAGEYCKHVWPNPDRVNLHTKWFFIPHVLGSRDCFDLNNPPYANFVEVIKWRNLIVHYEHRFKKPQPINEKDHASKVYSVCNLRNAQTAFETTASMIRRLSEKTSIPVPTWLERSNDWFRLLPQ